MVRDRVPADLLSVPDHVLDDLVAGVIEVLRDPVHDGARVGFVHVPAVEAASRRTRYATPRVAETVSVRIAQPENAAHRVDVTKLLVLREFRGRAAAWCQPGRPPRSE